VERRTFDEKAVAAILQRASQLERRRSEGAELSLAEIEQIARESGIDPAMVRQAVRDLELAQAGGTSAKLAGAPVRTVFERVVKREISAADHEALASEIRDVLAPLSSTPPQVSSLGRSLTVSAALGRSLVEVHLTPRDGQTVIRVSLNSSQHATGLFGGLLGGLGGGLGSNVGIVTGSLVIKALELPAPVGVALGASAFLAVAGGAYTLARALFSRTVTRNSATLERLVDRLEARLSA
jgi:hypothetical protein